MLNSLAIISRHKQTRGLKMSIELLLSDARGVYIPRDFVNDFDLTNDGKVGWFSKSKKVYKKSALSFLDKKCLANPDSDFYWDKWYWVLDNLYYIDEDGNKFELHQDGDLFAICYEKLTDEERLNFFGEE